MNPFIYALPNRSTSFHAYESQVLGREIRTVSFWESAGIWNLFIF